MNRRVLPTLIECRADAGMLAPMFQVSGDNLKSGVNDD